MKSKQLKRIMSTTITGTMILTVLPIGVSASTGSFTEDFESSLNTDYWYAEVPNETAIQPSTNYSQSGTHSLRVELNKSDPNVNDGKRAEIRIGAGSPMSEGPLEEHTYTFYTLLPNGGDEDYKLDSKCSEILAQWHNQPDANEQWTSPPLALNTYNGDYVIGRCWDASAISTSEGIEKQGNVETVNLGSYVQDKGHWVKWEFHVKWGWLANQEPILEVYKDGKLVLNRNGLPNTTNDKIGVVMKLGMYKWDWAQANDESLIKKRVVYFDNVSITTQNAAVVAVNKNELQGLYDVNKNKAKWNYTDASWNGFTTALSNANSIIGKANATQAEVDLAKTNLQSAISRLVVRTSSSSGSGGNSSDNNDNESSSDNNDNESSSDNDNEENSSDDDDDDDESSSDSLEIEIISNNQVQNSTTNKIDMNNSSNSSIVSTVENIGDKISQINKDDQNVQVDEIYDVSSNTFKGNVANLNSEENNYIYVSSKSATENTTSNQNKIEINVSNLNNEGKYVYNLDSLTNNLILLSNVGFYNAENNVIQIQPQSGMQYIITDTKMEALKNNDWNKITNEWIYVKDGHSVTGWYKTSDNKWYYMNNKGIMQTGWVNDNGIWYHLSSTGAMDTGWIKDNGKWYHLSSNGAMDIGWIKDDGKWYHLSNSGAMAIGWIKDTNNKWYYLNANGSMASNTKINGYKLDKSGAWIK